VLGAEDLGGIGEWPDHVEEQKRDLRKPIKPSGREQQETFLRRKNGFAEKIEGRASYPWR
jgi:hypothetical protein